MRLDLIYHKSMSRVLGFLSRVTFRLGYRKTSMWLGAKAYGQSSAYYSIKGRTDDT